MSNLKNNTKIAQAEYFCGKSFLRRSDENFGVRFITMLEEDVEQGRAKRELTPLGGGEIIFRKLTWDTLYFGIPTYKIDFIFNDKIREDAVQQYKAQLQDLQKTLDAESGNYYAFIELPAEMTEALQAACLSGWRLIETRLTYYNDNIQAFNFARRFPVRRATVDDTQNLMNTARAARNLYDRFHADPFFSENIADDFIATFVQNSISGYADITLVPDTGAEPPSAFLTANYIQEQASKPEGKMVLSAVGPERRGWYLKLISEMSYIMKERGIETVYMTTQATNTVVIKTWEKIGYKYGKTSHILSFNTGKQAI